MVEHDGSVLGGLKQGRHGSSEKLVCFALDLYMEIEEVVQTSDDIRTDATCVRDSSNRARSASRL